MHFANVAFNLSFHSKLEEILQQVYIVPPKIMKYSQRWGTKIIFCYINVRPKHLIFLVIIHPSYDEILIILLRVIHNTSALDDPSDKTSLRCLASLESIDDDLDSHGIPAVKMSDVVEARQYGVKNFPSIIVFVKKVPELYRG